MAGIAESALASTTTSRWLLLAGVAALVTATWVYLVWMQVGMQRMAMQPPSGPDLRPWGMADLALVFWMWAVMMAAMMLPTAVPAILVFDRIARDRRRTGRPGGVTWMFVAGYVLAWTGFSVVATLAQWALHAAAALSAGMSTTCALTGAAILVAAGAYQWSPLKGRCLAHCRSPLEFLAAHWREGRGGGLIMGMRHGAYCVGCCWMLMAVLFVAGVMNLAWIALLSAAALVEKTSPRGPAFARAMGIALIAWGTWLALSA